MKAENGTTLNRNDVKKNFKKEKLKQVSIHCPLDCISDTFLSLA